MVDKSASRIILLERRAERERQRRQAAERAAERGLRRLYEVNQDLDQRVEERTAEALASLQAKEDALASRLEVLRIITNEILTPLHRIEGMLELVDPSPLQEVDQRRFAACATAAERCVQLVRDVLDLATIETGTASESVQPSRPLDLLDKAIAVWHSPAAERGCTVVFEAEFDSSLEVPLDEVRTSRIVSELVASSVQLASTQILVKARIARTAAQLGDEINAEGTVEELVAAVSYELLVAVSHDGEPASLELPTLDILLDQELELGSSIGPAVGMLLAAQLAQTLGGSVVVSPSDFGGVEQVLRLPVG